MDFSLKLLPGFLAHFLVTSGTTIFGTMGTVSASNGLAPIFFRIFDFSSSIVKSTNSLCTSLSRLMVSVMPIISFSLTLSSRVLKSAFSSQSSTLSISFMTSVSVSPSRSVICPVFVANFVYASLISSKPVRDFVKMTLIALILSLICSLLFEFLFMNSG